MANTIAPSMPARSGDADPPPRRPRFAARRRTLMLLVVLVVAGIAIAANYGPVEAYRDAKARLEQATTAVSALDEQKTELQSQLGKLSEAAYLESMAREELSYTRPGEALYIVTGLRDGAAGTAAAGAGTEGTATGSADHPGLLERALNAIRGLF